MNKEEAAGDATDGSPDVVDNALDGLLGAPDDDGSGDDFDLDDLEDGADLAGDDLDGAADGSAQTVPYSRLKKVIAQRNALRAEREKLAAEAAEMRGRAEGLDQFRSVLTERYDRFENPAGQLTADAEFMEALERMAPTDAEVNTFYKKVLKFMETGTTEPTHKASSKKTEKAEPVMDPRISKLLARENDTLVAETLQPLNLQPRFLKLIQRHVASATEAGAELTTASIKAMTREFLDTTGFKLAEMRQTTPESTVDSTSGGKTRKPATRSGSVAAVNPSTKQDAASETKELTPEQVLRRREKLLDSVIAELGGA